jgi:hypothetical protein
MPHYPGLRHSMEVVQIKDSVRGNSHDATPDSEDWAAQYQAYLEGKEVAPETMNCDPTTLPTTADRSDSEEESWAVQYAKYCEEKERDLFG